MKKKILGIVITLAIMMGMMASQVKAATINASNTEVNKGDKITVTVKLDKPTQAIDLVLNYDANIFEYVKGSASSTIGDLTINDTVAGEVRLSAASATNSTTAVTYTFIAKENADASTFTASGLVTESEEEFTVNTVTVSVVEKEEQPTEDPTDKPEDEQPTEDPTDKPEDEQPAEDPTDKPAEDPETSFVDENGNTITKLPQTGVSVYQVVAGIAIVSIAAIFVVKKISK